jgi:phospholipid transport system substrate-binding protein
VASPQATDTAARAGRNERKAMNRRNLISAAAALAIGPAIAAVQAQDAAAPDEFIRKLSNEVLEAIKADKAIQAGDTLRIRTLVDARVMPQVNFERMTAMSVGPQWRSATPEQKKRMLEEFKTLLINTYSGALSQVKNQSVLVKPLRGGVGGDQVVVRTEVRGNGEPVQLDYRMEKNDGSWKIYDVNIAGFWIVEAYRGQFAKDLSSGGIEALINRLAEKNRSGGSGGQKS